MDIKQDKYCCQRYSGARHFNCAHQHQTPLQQTNILASSTSGKKTNVDQAAPDTSSLPTAPGILHASVRSVATSPSTRQPSPNPRLPNPDMDGDDLPKPLTMTGSDVPAAPTSSHTNERTTKRASKRTRIDCANDDASSPPKKVARNPRVESVTSVMESPAKTKAPTKLNIDREDQNAVEGGGSPVRHEIQAVAAPIESEASMNKPEAKSKTAPKKPIATAGRRRACDACKRRKVKCKHNLLEEEADDNSDLKKNASSKKPTAKTKKGAKPTLPNERDESADLEASTQKTVAQRGQIDDADDHDREAEEEPPKRTKSKKKAVPKKAAAPPGRSSTRNRNPPERFGDPEEHPSPKAAPVKKSTSRVFDPVYITTNSTSRLGKADMHRMLLSDAAWTSLSAEQQIKLVSMLPDTPEHQQLIARIKAGETINTRPWAFTLSNDCFRTDVAKFKEDLKNGHLAKTWQAAAEQAVIERAAGEYDSWKAEEAELWWGQKSK